MIKLHRALFLLALFLLTACGPLDIRVETLSTPSAVPTPTVDLPGPTPAPTRRVVTATPTIAFTSTPAQPDLHLKVGAPVKIIQTRMLTAQTGWAIGESSQDLVQHVLFTADGGRTWKDTTPLPVLTEVPAGGFMATVYFASADSAWALYSPRTPGGPEGQKDLLVWHTGDGGKTWTAGQPLDVSTLREGTVEYQVPSNLAFLDAQHGWVLLHLGAGMSHDYFAAFTTADGGQTWQRILDPDTKYPLMGCVKSGIAFTSPTSGWITGNCPGLMPDLFIFHTTDGGVTWAQADLPVPPGKPANYFASGIACGLGGIDYSSPRALALTLTCTNYTNNTAQSWLYTSSDAGGTWSQRLLPVLYTRIDLLTAEEGFLVGSMQAGQDATGAVYHTSNGGATWLLTTSTGWTGLPDFVNSQTGWVVAVHSQVTAFVRTTDGGRTWVELKPVIGS